MSSGEMRVLVTGANGFIGSHLAEALVAAGYRVRCLVRRTSDLRFVRDLPVAWAYGALDDAASLRAACDGVDAVYHCAALTRALDEATFLRVNAQGTEALARACLEASPGLRRFVFVSSLAAAGPAPGPDRPVEEGDAPNPVTWYGESKLAAEGSLRAMGKALPLAIVRPAPVFGPRDRDFLAYFQLVKRGLSLQLGRGERLVSLIYVGDLVALLLRALESPEALGRTYFGCGPASSYGEFAQAIARAMGKQPVTIRLPLWVLGAISAVSGVEAAITKKPALLNNQRVIDMAQRYWLCSGERARRELGFAPATDLDEAVRETADWYRRAGWL